MWSTSKNYNDDLQFTTGVVVIKNHYSQLNDLEQNDISTFRWLIAPDWYTVRLLRKNFVEQCLSLALANQLIQYDTHLVERKIKLDCEKLVQYACPHIWENWVLHAENPYNIDYQETYYTEDLVNYVSPDISDPNRSKEHIILNYEKSKNVVRKYVSRLNHELIEKNGDELRLK
jgi:hypothetical protein